VHPRDRSVTLLPVSGRPDSIGAVSFVANISLAAVKIMVGAVGASYALIADGIESLADCLSSLVVWNGLRVAGKAADHDHPYGHGKAEPMAAFLAGIGLVISAIIIGYNAIREILSPQLTPAAFIIPALIGIILAKEVLYRYTLRYARLHDSHALHAKAWHHRSDSLTSLGVLCGILIAVLAGPAYAWVDDLAACLVTLLILYNAYRILHPAIDELMDRRIEDVNHRIIMDSIASTEGVLGVETLIVRRSGRAYLVDVHLEVDPQITVKDGHAIAHRVKDQLLAMPVPHVAHVTTHVEPGCA
jgi:cation diffusion facilitator family transporter